MLKKDNPKTKSEEELTNRKEKEIGGRRRRKRGRTTMAKEPENEAIRILKGDEKVNKHHLERKIRRICKKHKSKSKYNRRKGQRSYWLKKKQNQKRTNRGIEDEHNA